MTDALRGRRDFLKGVAASAAAAASLRPESAAALGRAAPTGDKMAVEGAPPPQLSHGIAFPRRHTGMNLSRIVMPLGGIGTGGIGLGGRGNFQDWQIYNKPSRGRKPNQAFASVWARVGERDSVARVLERRLLPPYDQMHEGLGQWSAPALPRFVEAEFIGAFPLARIAFTDPGFPLAAAMEAFSPFEPLDADISGLPAAIVAYEVRNTAREVAEVAVAFALFNPVTLPTPDYVRSDIGGTPTNAVRRTPALTGIYMTNPGFAADSPDFGTFSACPLPEEGTEVELQSHWLDNWENGAQHFWFDEFARAGRLGPERSDGAPVGTVLQRRRLQPGEIATFRFVLAWHFPNRTPARCGWKAPKGYENSLIGNRYAARFRDAWTVAELVAARAAELEATTRRFVDTLTSSTLPPVVLEAASANLSTLVSNTSMRLADGNFHGFEGCGDEAGWGWGTCKHVWNYETATHYLFPALSRSMVETSLGPALSAQGAIDLRHYLPLGLARGSGVAADGQMGQLVHLYMDWRASGDDAWLRNLWPAAKRALAFAWRKGGWDADHNGVMEGAQHCTYDVELFGPNPMCGSWYLAALHATAEMAAAMGEPAFGAQCRALAEAGGRWIDRNLFNGEYYEQRVVGHAKEAIDPQLLLGMGAKDTTAPDYQIGPGCLVDQLVGQYMAGLAGLPPLLDPSHVRATMRSIYRYNYKRELGLHPSVQRAYALNDEAGLAICDYPRGGRPSIPLPYYSEVMSGFEYSAAILMIASGMAAEGVECIGNIRARHDGLRRNPFDETEYGRNYARAMASWGSIPACTGFMYHGGRRSLSLLPQVATPLRAPWSTPAAWGRLELRADAALELTVHGGELVLGEIRLNWRSRRPNFARVGGEAVAATAVDRAHGVTLRFDPPISVTARTPLSIMTTSMVAR